MDMIVKRYIKVVTLVDKEGDSLPLFVIWDNGVKYQIDKVLTIRECYSKAGGIGIEFKCLICGHIRCLFLERNRWFVESKIYS